MQFNKSYTKWSKQDVLDKLKEISEQDNTFPTKERLIELKESRASNAIGHLKLKYHDLAIELGYVPKQKPKGYWTEYNVLKELKLIIDELDGVYPTSKFINQNRPDLRKAIFSTRDWRYYKSKLGFKVKEKWSRGKVLERIKSHIETLGCVPSTTELLKIDKHLLSAIDRLQNNYGELLLELGHQPIQRVNGFWKIWENVADEILPHCKDDKMPTVSYLRNKIGSTVGLAIADFGGVAAVAERLGVEISPESYLTSLDGHALKSQYEVEFDNFLHENNIPHEVDREITSDRKIRYDFKIGDVFVEIWGFKNRPNNPRCERYNKKRIDKEKVYREKSLKLVSIECNVFRKNKQARHKIFKEKLEESGITLS